MAFTSLKFIVFLAAAAGLYYICPMRCQKYLLLAASFCFYAMFGWKAFALILVSTLTAFFGAHVIGNVNKGRYRKAALTVFVALEIGTLVCLKYIGFIIDSLSLVVPVGISFYTLSVIGYLIDIYRRKYPAEENIVHFMLYVMYFPHILQGPIARYDNFSEYFSRGG